MDNKQFTSRLARRTSLDYKEANMMLKATVSTLIDMLKQADAVAVPSFGTFSVVKTDEHIDADVATGGRTLMPPSIEMKFTPSAILVRKVADANKSNPELR